MKPPKSLTKAAIAAMPLPELKGRADKERRGRVVIVGGSEQVPGALVLAGLGALRAGAGKLQFATTKALAQSLAFAVPESLVRGSAAVDGGELGPTAARDYHDLADEADCVVVGPGMFEPDAAAALTLALLSGEGKASFVIDSAALTGMKPHLATLKAGRRDIVLTPHLGEMAALTGLALSEIEDDPLAIARSVAQESGAVVVLKSSTTWVIGPDGGGFIHHQDSIGLGTAGSGDVLAGVIGGLLARGAAVLQAAAWGVFLHAKAGQRLSKDIAPLGFLAREIPDRIPAVMAAASAPRRTRGARAG